jgi:putative membrane protein
MVAMAKTLIPAADHDRISAAVAQAELASDGEIATMVAAKSDDYRDWALLLTLLAGLTTLALIAAFPACFSGLLLTLSGAWHGGYSAGELIAAALAAQILTMALVWLALGWMPLRLALTPRSIKVARVRREAVRAFRIGIESRTRAATGVLIYLSLAEHRAEIVADAAINTHVQPGDWGDAMAALTADVRDGRPGDGIVEAVEMVGALIARHFPPSHDDINEMPDRLIEL